MKIIIASDSFKGSCSTFDVADAIERGINNALDDVDIVKVPVADGGEGTVEALVYGAEGQFEEVKVVDPLGTPVIAKYGILRDHVAVVEMASASGLPLVKKEDLNPLNTTSYGTGELLKAAMDKGCRKIFIGIGGSATNDGGMGMAQALGVSFKDIDGNELGFGGGELSKLHKIDTSNKDERLRETEIIVMSDVSNPLCGENGASYVYGPQKGADNEMVDLLDDNLEHYSGIIYQDLGIDVKEIPGSGAAGGIGAALIAFCDTKPQPGIERVLDVIELDKKIEDADIVLTGEGRIDSQSLYGKVPIGVAKRALKQSKPVIAIVGSIGEGAMGAMDHGINAIVDIINKPLEVEEAMEKGPIFIEESTENLMNILKVGMTIDKKTVFELKEGVTYENGSA